MSRKHTRLLEVKMSTPLAILAQTLIGGTVPKFDIFILVLMVVIVCISIYNLIRFNIYNL